MNLSLPAAPAGSGSVGGSACGDIRALPSWEVLWPVTGSVWLSWMERLPVPCLFTTRALGGLPFTHLCILPQCSWGSPLEANSSLAPLQQVGMLCESTHTGNQADHQTTAKMQRVDLSACLTDSTGQHRHTGTRAPFGFVHPSKQRHTGTQALFGLFRIIYSFYITIPF